jgi:uncharacterized protein DUF1016
MTKALQLPPGYAALLKDIKERVRTAQMCATLAVNRELILLYWSIGRDILDRQKAEGSGTKVIDRLAKGLGTEFPGVEGFSPRSLKHMRTFAGEWPDNCAAGCCTIALGADSRGPFLQSAAGCSMEFDAGRPRLPLPKQPECMAMPADQGCRLDN